MGTMAIVQRVLMWAVCLALAIVTHVGDGSMRVRAVSGGGAPGGGAQIVDGGTPVSDRDCLAVCRRERGSPAHGW